MSEPFISFFVPGVPAPGGSKRFLGLSRRTGRAILVDAAGERNKNWRERVSTYAYGHAPATLLEGPLRVTMDFFMPRPKGHFHTSKKRLGELREDAPHWHTVKPDLTKCIRSTEDALTGVIWRDDAIICSQTATKRYGAELGCRITVSHITNDVGSGLP